MSKIQDSAHHTGPYLVGAAQPQEAIATAGQAFRDLAGPRLKHSSVLLPARCSPVCPANTSNSMNLKLNLIFTSQLKFLPLAFLFGFIALVFMFVSYAYVRHMQFCPLPCSLYLKCHQDFEDILKQA